MAARSDGSGPRGPSGFGDGRGPERRPLSGVPDESLSERAWIESRGLIPRKRLGQNFLLDRNIPRQIITRAGWAADSPVLEIGPGGGALTSHLLEQGRVMTAVEIDQDLCGLLRERFDSFVESGALRLVPGDILELPLPELAAEVRERAASRPSQGAVSGAVADHGDPAAGTGMSGIAPAGPAGGSCSGQERLVWLAGNLPYGVTTPILLQCLAARESLEGAVLMVQREYGERMLAGPGTKAYSSLSVWTAAQAEARLLLRVGRSVFWPRPGVESVVVELRFPRPAPFPGDLRKLERVLRGAFGQRRKTLENSLASVLQRPKQEIREGILAAGIDPQVRGETLDLEAFARLSETLGGL